MAFLSLSRGDPAARELLERAIRARYGLRPPALDSRRLWLKGRAKGPLGLPASVLLTVSYALPNFWRWDQTRKFLGITLDTTSASFGGTNYYERVKGNVTVTDDPRTVAGARQRLWAEIVFSLTPLTMPGTTLKSVDDTTFQALRDSEPETVATVRLDSNDMVTVETTYFQPTLQQMTSLKLVSQGGLQTLEGYVVPKQIVYQWGDGTVNDFTVIKAEANPKISPAEFVLS
jgi:hypothetical protein